MTVTCDEYVRRFADQHRRRGIGSVFVLTDAYALTVDAKDDSSAAFYVHFGFKPFLHAKRTLYLPLGR